MNDFDVIVRGGRVATAADVVECDIGIRDGRIAALANGPSKAPAGSSTQPAAT